LALSVARAHLRLLRILERFFSVKVLCLDIPVYNHTLPEPYRTLQALQARRASDLVAERVIGLSSFRAGKRRYFRVVLCSCWPAPYAH